MLRELHIRNVSVIRDITVEFGRGLNVITGETGAGKSIIINALSLVLGERLSGDIIRTGEEEALIEALFDLPSDRIPPDVSEYLEDHAIDATDGLVLKRIISSRGKNRVYVNGSISQVQTLATLSRSLVDIHGQYEHQSLLSPVNQLYVLDVFGDLTGERNRIAALYKKISELRQGITDLENLERDRLQKIDLLQYQVNEIDAANLQPGEDDELERELNILKSAVRLAELASVSYEELYANDSSCLTMLSGILKNLQEISSIDDSASEAASSIESALPLLEEASGFLRDYRDRIEFNSGRLEQVQERLDLISGLKRKYGQTIDEILSFRDSASAELEKLQKSEETLGSLKEELDAVTAEYIKKATLLTRKRQKAAADIEKRVTRTLADLAMQQAEFSILFKNENREDRFTPNGMDSIEFMISPNPGEELRPLRKIASGGELSRIMLALKSILAGGDNIPVLIFDEIDSGIGGRTAETVGRKLRELSESHQIICITHLPQIAAYASHHIRIDKTVTEGRTEVRAASVSQKQRAEEIARMLGGEISKASLKHAEEMLGKAAGTPS
jgi:DNA repair protein RecN (Recombination protein N)